jgi:hypothetical protein
VPRIEESRSSEGNEDGEIGPSGGIEPWRSSRAREGCWGRRPHWGVVGRTPGQRTKEGIEKLHEEWIRRNARDQEQKRLSRCFHSF